MKGLHPKQEKILHILKERENEPLSIRDLGALLGIRSSSHVHHHIIQLEKKGFLKRDPHSPSNFFISLDEPEKRVSYLPMYGMAHCGPGGYLLDGNPERRIPVSTDIIKFRAVEAFLLKAKGNSMSPRINENDIVLAKKTNDIQDGEIMICVNDGEVLIKKIIIGKNNSQEESICWLTSLNQDVPPFPASEDFHVEGIVKGILFRGI